MNLQFLPLLSLIALCKAEATADPDSQFEYGIFGTANHAVQTPSHVLQTSPHIIQAPRNLVQTPVHVQRPVERSCKVEMITISRTNCRVEFDEECTTEEKVVGDKVTYEKECEEEEVEECKPVHYIPRQVTVFILI